MSKRFVLVPLLSILVVAAILLFGPSWSHDIELLAVPVAGILAVLAGHVRARSAGRRRRDALAARQAAAAAERARLARDMHDSLSKTLDALALGAAALPTTLDEPGRARRLAQTLQDASEHAAWESRKLIGDLRDAAPGLLDRDTVTTLGERWSRETGIPVSVAVDDVDVADETAYELVWILREALRNIAAHASASHASIVLAPTDGGETITLAVTDDGHGFDVPPSLSPLQHSGHLGLVGMTERASVCGGRLDVTSSPAGTRIEARVPALPAPAPAGGSGLPAMLVAVAVLAVLAGVVVFARHPAPSVPVPSTARSESTVASGPSSSLASPQASASGPSSSSASPPALASGPASALASAPASVVPAAPPSPAAHAASRVCGVDYVLRTQWDPGFIADLHITNRGTAAIAPWTLRFTFPGDQHLISSWSGINATQSGRSMTITGTSENTTLAAGRTIVISIQGTWTSDDSSPISFTLNGVACG